MAQTSIEKKVCDACGAEERPNARFCFSCGGILVTKDAAKNDATSTDAPSVVGESSDDNRSNDGLVRQNADYEPTEIKVVKVKKQVIAETVSAPDTSANQTSTEPEIKKKSSVHEQAKLKSAASLRRKSKTLQPKIVEEIWQEHESAPNVWFIAAAIFLTVLAGGFLFLAMYLK